MPAIKKRTSWSLNPGLAAVGFAANVTRSGHVLLLNLVVLGFFFFFLLGGGPRRDNDNEQGSFGPDGQTSAGMRDLRKGQGIAMCQLNPLCVFASSFLQYKREPNMGPACCKSQCVH